MRLPENLSSALERIIHDPLTFAASVVAAFLAILFVNQAGFGGWLASGALAQAFNGLMALAFALVVVRVATFLKLTLTKGEAKHVSNHPLARAILSAGLYTFAGLLALAVFG